MSIAIFILAVAIAASRIVRNEDTPESADWTSPGLAILIGFIAIVQLFT